LVGENIELPGLALAPPVAALASYAAEGCIVDEVAVAAETGDKNFGGVIVLTDVGDMEGAVVAVKGLAGASALLAALLASPVARFFHIMRQCGPL
jgi:hypothetical protein